MIRIVLGFILGFVLCCVFYKLVGRHHKRLAEIVRNFPQPVDISLYNDSEGKDQLRLLN